MTTPATAAVPDVPTSDEAPLTTEQRRVALTHILPLAHHLRTKLDALTAQLREATQAFDAAHADLLADIEATKAARDFAEADAKVLTLDLYRDTGEKKPVPGVSIKEFAAIHYDADQAHSWAVEHELCLTPAMLDKKAFEKLAPDLHLSWVTITKEPRAQLDRDLTAAVASLTPPSEEPTP